MNYYTERFQWGDDKKLLSWCFNSNDYDKRFVYALQSVIQLKDNSGFAVVASYEEYGKQNAMIINVDGSIRFFLEIPETIKNAICVHEIYYIGKELTAIIATNHFDYACVIDEKTGNYLKIYETR